MILSRANPKQTYALVVGIEKYEAGSKWDLDGPVNDARLFTDWLCSKEVPPENIWLFLSPLDKNRDLVEKLELPVKVATQQNLSEAIKDFLPNQKGDLLYLFWGGHGFISPAEERKLFYADAKAPSWRHLELDSLLKALRTDYFRGFPQQICFIDACATYNRELHLQMPSLEGETFSRKHPRRECNQFVLFAAKLGEAAGNNTERRTGLLSEAIREELAQESANCWPPDMEELAVRIKRRLKDVKCAKQTPVCWSHRGWNDNEDKDYEGISLSLTVGGRYKIIRHLGSGEFGDTHLAEDLHFPGKPRCVIKQLRSQHSQKARDSFDREANVLYQLNSHDQIPNLLAHFEDGDFYLVHQFIEGQTLSHELIDGQPWSDSQVIKMLQDILQILVFIHQHRVIHRHINPKSLIRRSSDGKIVLMNFGGIKEISTGQTRTFAGTKTKGYMPPEQGSGLVLFCSDIYAVGIIGIQALTGLNPKQLKLNSDGDIVWREKAQVSLKFADILDKMVRYDFKIRYQSAADALQAILDLEASE